MNPKQEIINKFEKMVLDEVKPILDNYFDEKNKKDKWER